MNVINRICIVALLLTTTFLFTACDSGDDDKVYFEWQKVEVPGAICGNGSQYKIFVNYSDKSDNLLVYFEGGGACWDYEGCTGQNGIRGAANPNGIPDDYVIKLGQPQLMSPFVWRNHPWDSVPTKDWNIVFIPYCTGDIFIGDKVITYEDPTGEQPDLLWHHAGFPNTLKVIDWMKAAFPHIPEMLVTGCSAGGAGSILNYHFIRHSLNADKGTLLNDSGPIYPAPDPSYKSYPLHQKIRSSWGLDSVEEQFLSGEWGTPPAVLDLTDYGTLNDALAAFYPNDRLAHTQFTMDGNYSGYSYEAFNGCGQGECPDLVHDYWAIDQANLMGLYDEYDNWGYWIPYFRPFNESHCTCILSFADTDITGTGMDMKDYINDLLKGDGPVPAYYEAPDPAEFDKPYWDWTLLDYLMELL